MVRTPTGIKKIYSSLELSASQRLLLFCQDFKGKLFLHLRLWYLQDGMSEFVPGRGLVLPKDPGKIHELADALHAMADDYPWEGDDGGDLK